MSNAWIGALGIMLGACLTAFFAWMAARSASRRSRQLTNAEQDRLRTNDIINQQRIEIDRCSDRAERAERKLDQAEVRYDRAVEKIYHLDAELAFAHSEIGRLGGPTTENV